MSYQDSDFIEIPALMGEDVNRYPGTLCLEVIDGKPHDAISGEPISIVSVDEMKGWGDLSGVSYLLSNGVDVNAEDWKWD